MISWHGYVFRNVEIFWTNFRRFCYYNRTIFEIVFIFLYAVEQGGLILFTFNIKNPRELGLIVSIFAVIVLITFALHKLLMESRIKMLENELSAVLEEKLALGSKTNYIIEKYNEVTEAYNEIVSKDLNNDSTIITKKWKTK